MSFDPLVDTDHDEKMYEQYLSDCRALHITPSLRDYVIWLQEIGRDVDD